MEAAVQGKAGSGNVELLGLLFTAPKKAFAALDARPRFWFALLLTVAGTVGLLFWYYSIVDIDWLREQMLSANPRVAQMSDADRERAAVGMSRPVLLWSSVIGIAIFVPILRVVEATYYLLAGNLTNVQRSFRHWLAFSCWTGIPHLIGVIPAVLLLLLRSSDQLNPGEISPLSLNELFFHRGMSEPGFQLLTSVTLLHLVVWALTVLGVQAWSNRSWLFSAIFALLPPVLLYGGWAAFAFTR